MRAGGTVLSNGQVEITGPKRERRYLVHLYRGSERARERNSAVGGECDTVFYFNTFSAGMRGQLISW